MQKWWWWWWLLLYSAVLRSRADSLHWQVILHEWLAFYGAFLNIHRSGVLTALAWLVPHETAAVSVQVPCTSYNHAPCHFMQSHIMHVISCNLPPALLAEWPGSFSFACYCTECEQSLECEQSVISFMFLLLLFFFLFNRHRNVNNLLLHFRSICTCSSFCSTDTGMWTVCYFTHVL